MPEVPVMGGASAPPHNAEDPNEPMVSLSPMQVMSLRKTIEGANMYGYTQVLELLELVLPDERQYQRARSRVLGLANDQSVILTRIIQDTLFPREGTRRSNGQGANGRSGR